MSGIFRGSGSGGGGNAATQFDADTGSAVPSSGVIIDAGGTGLSSSASGNTVTYNLDVPVIETNGGTGQTTYTTGDLLYSDTTNSLAKLPVGGFPGSQLIVGFDGVVKWFDPSIHILLYDDFLSGISFGSLGWKGNAGGGIIRTNQTALSTNPGYFSLQTGTSSTSTPSLTLFEFNAWGGEIFGAGRARFHFYCKLSALSDGTETYLARIGFGDQQAAAPNNGLWFEYTHSVNSGNWTIKSANGGSTTTANTSTAASTNWTLFAIEVNAAATSVSYYINGTQVANSPIVTNIPATFCGPLVGLVKSVGTTSRLLDIDQFFFFQELTNARSA